MSAADKLQSLEIDYYTTKATLTRFRPDNYEYWAWCTKLALQGKNLLSTIDSTVHVEAATTEAEDDAKIAERSRQDAQALMLIISTIPEEYAADLQKFTMAKQVWDYLATSYSKKGIVQWLEISRKYSNLRKSPSMSPNDYVLHHSTIAHRYKTAASQWNTEDLARLTSIAVFLNGLPEEFTTWAGGLEAQMETLTIEDVYAKYRLEAERLTSRGDTASAGFESTSPAQLQALQAKAYPKSTSRKPRFANHGTRGTCDYCNKPGHYIRECLKRISDERRKDDLKGGSSSSAGMAVHACGATKGADSLTYWIVDSGASDHMAPNRSWFQNYRHLGKSLKVTGVGGMKFHAIGIGRISIKDEHGNDAMELRDVLHVPRLKEALISVCKGLDGGIKFDWTPTKCVITNARQPARSLVALRNRQNLYTVPGTYLNSKLHDAAFRATATQTDASTWHERLGHLSRHGMEQIQKSVDIPHIAVTDLSDICEACIKGKQHRKPHQRNTYRSQRKLALVHSDLCGPFQEASLGGSFYFVTFIDDCTRHSRVYTIARKDAMTVRDVFAEYKAAVEGETGYQILKLRTDNGKEYQGVFGDYLRQHHIQHQTTAAYTPQMNGVAERLNRTLLEIARPMLSAHNIPFRFWGEAINTAMHIRNRTPNASIKFKTPYELWYGRKPSLNHLRIFGCTAWVHVPKESGRQKLDDKSKRMCLVGYISEKGIYKVYDPTNGKFSSARDIIFDEKKFFTPQQLLASARRAPPSPRDSDQPILFTSSRPSPIVHDEIVVMRGPPSPSLSRAMTPATEGDRDLSDEEDIYGQPLDIERERSDQESNGTEDPPTQEPRRSQRISRPRVPFGGTIKNANFPATNRSSLEPRTYEEAISGMDAEKWKAAMESELRSMEINNVWNVVGTRQHHKETNRISMGLSDQE